MRQVRFAEFGRPEECAACVAADAPRAGEGEVLLRVLAAPVNPADINFIEGTYGTRPQLPAVAGNEACAEVVECGAGVSGCAPGDRAVVVGGGGLWSDLVVRPAAQVVPVPSRIDPLQACQLAVNPPTAWLLLNQFAELGAGDWVAQNAANSAVGRCVIQIARRRGWKTINFVRRRELLGELEALGGEAVMLDDAGSVDAARELSGGGPRLALNAVGGDSALRLMDLLAQRGLMVTYGAMSRKSLKVPNSFLIFKRIRLEGLWVTRWVEEAGDAKVREVFAELAAMMADGDLVLPVEKTYPPEEIAAALEHAQRGERSGKVLLDFRGAAEL